MNENEVMKKEREVMKKSHLEALISEWKFQCAEGIYTYPTERMFEICYTDAYEQGRKEATKELEAQIEKLKQDLDVAIENANRQEQWEIYSTLNDIYNNNFEVVTSVSN